MAIVRNKGNRLNQYVKDYIVFDLETTGFRFGLDEIIEVSALKVKNSEVVEEFSSLVRPGINIPPAATAVNGITDLMVRDAPELETVIGEFLEFIETGILVGHNIHSFDTNFIYDAAMQVFQKEIKNDYIDTLYLAKRGLPQLGHHKLSDVSEYFQIDTAGAHRALNDCIMNQKCYEKLWQIILLQGENQKTGQAELVCPKCGGEMMKRKGQFGEFYGCGNFPRCRFTKKI